MNKLIVMLCAFIGAWGLATYFLGPNNSILYHVGENKGGFDITLSFAIACIVGYMTSGLTEK